MPEATYRFGDLAFKTGGLAELDQTLRRWRQDPGRTGKLLGFVNPHVYNQYQREAAVRDFLDRCDWVCVDGIGIVVASRLLYRAAPPRVVATRLFDRALAWKDSKTRMTAVLIGGTPEQTPRAAAAINDAGGAWRIVGMIDGFRNAEDYPALLQPYSTVDAVLVGAGSPKSERILLAARLACPKALCWHIGGGTLSVHAGDKARAPGWLSAIGCEWLHRYVLEPHYRPRVHPGGAEFVRHALKHRFSATRECQS
ncbi:WecB/TagA/CpsF family glycosyltransferase [Methylomonas sp. MED-D]|uniref:WecB/TagA/CpsF family glycosyltransferase n=1 Tax=unclassified Methylomonas TaxID=2608980 RepID=UPI0028A4CA46|nr:WecB/TagA/CpsF family glycosyltransferase [Methylomonas sp. MV1]MDT4328607.1 WecB/TagA/CpsF family glycosyltransferase [Methylomonas sp. MV1]